MNNSPKEIIKSKAMDLEKTTPIFYFFKSTDNYYGLNPENPS